MQAQFRQKYTTIMASALYNAQLQNIPMFSIQIMI